MGSSNDATRGDAAIVVEDREELVPERLGLGAFRAQLCGAKLLTGNAFPLLAKPIARWVCASWSSSKGESGPSSAAASIGLPAGTVMPQASAKPSMKLRAAA